MSVRLALMMKVASVALLLAGAVASGLWLDRGYTPALGATVACFALAGILLILARKMRQASRDLRLEQRRGAVRRLVDAGHAAVHGGMLRLEAIDTLAACLTAAGSPSGC